MASASRNNTPSPAARPVATMIDIGVANPSAQGQAMIKTEIALSTANVHDGSGPNSPHTKKVATAIARTASTNQQATLRPDERRVGKDGVRRCRSRGSQYHYKKKKH